jgi:hypothetical protein
MKSKSCLPGACIFGALAFVIRLTQYIISIDENGFYRNDTLSLVLNIALIATLCLGTLWCLICGFGGKKKQPPFENLFQKDDTVPFYFGLLGVLAVADGLFRLWQSGLNIRQLTDIQLGHIAALFCLLGGIIWILLSFFSVQGKSIGLWAILPVLHLSFVILDYFWQTYKFIHVSEYILTTLGLCAALLFVLALMKPAGGGTSTGQRICSTAGLVIVFSFGALLPMLPVTLIHRLRWQDLALFLSGAFYLLLAIHTLRQLSHLPADQPAPQEERPDLSALYEYLSDLPEVDDEAEQE